MSSHKTATEENPSAYPQESIFPELGSIDPASVLEGVPAHLYAAASSIRKDFTDAVVGWGLVTRDVCYAQLHDDWSDGRQAAFDHLKMLCMRPAERQAFDDALYQTEQPQMLKGTFNLFLEGLREHVEQNFRLLLRIGIEHEAELTLGPVEWAQGFTNAMIRSRRVNAEEWIRQACGDCTEWEGWRAPRLLAMAHGTIPCDAARLWEPLDPKSSRAFAEAYADHFVRNLLAVIERAARAAHVEQAVRKAYNKPPAAQLGPVAIAPTIMTSGKAAQRKRTSAPASPAAKRKQIIARVAAMGYRDEEYFIQLDGHGVKPPLGWKVASYAEAYQDKDLRQKVFKERYKASHQ